MKRNASPRELTLAILHAKPSEFIGWVKQEGGLTNTAYRLGERMTESDLPLIESAEAKSRDIFRKIDMKQGLTSAMEQGYVSQFFNEAIRFYKAFKEAKLGASVTHAATYFGVDAGVLSKAVHTRG